MAWKRVKDNTVFETGDIVETSSSLFGPFVLHYGMIFYEEETVYISHNPFIKDDLSFSPEIVQLDSFKKDRRLLRYLRTKQTQKLTDEYIKEKSEALIDSKKYQGILFNCEDYLRELSKNSFHKLDQRVIWIIVIIMVILILYLLLRHRA